jgi:hypothetical protein
MTDTAASRITAALQAAVAPTAPTATGTPGDRTAAWHVAELLAADWSERPLTPADGYTDADLDAAATKLGHPLPTALREALKLFGRRDDLTRNQDPLATPDDLDTYEGALIYREENQGVCAWGVLLEDLDQDDPPTYLRPDLADKNEEEWLPWTDKLSLAIVEALITETIIGENENLTAAWEPGDEALEDTGLTALPRIQPDWYKTAWYVGDDVLAHVAVGAWISIRARTPEALAAYTGDDED